MINVTSYEEIERELERLIPSSGIKKVLLVVPPDADESLFSINTAKRKRYWNYPPYGLGIIAKLLLQHGIEVNLINLNHHILKTCNESEGSDEIFFDRIWQEKIRNVLAESAPDLIAVTCMFTQTHNSLKKLCAYIKSCSNEYTIAAGGVHITNSYQDCDAKNRLLRELQDIDLYFLYESEYAFVNFIRVANKQISLSELHNIHFTKINKSIRVSVMLAPKENSINVLPLYDLMQIDELSNYGKIGSFYCLKKHDAKYATILANRGCRANCSFCSVRNFNGKGVRHKDNRVVLDELKVLKYEYGIDHIMWLDDDFLHDRRNKLALFNDIIKENLEITWDCTNGVLAASCTEEVIHAAQESGCIGLNIGVESGNSDILKRIKKPAIIDTFINASTVLRRYPLINARVFLMIGFPGETRKMVMDTYQVAISMDLDWYNITIFQPLPNTRMYANMLETGDLDYKSSDSIRYNVGGYGKLNESTWGLTQNSYPRFGEYTKQQLSICPSKNELSEIWFSMNHLLNFNRLETITSQIKLFQQYRYIKNIADTIAPNDAVALYFYGQLYERVHGFRNRLNDITMQAIVNNSPYWKKRFTQLNLNRACSNMNNFVRHNASSKATSSIEHVR